MHASSRAKSWGRGFFALLLGAASRVSQLVHPSPCLMLRFKGRASTQAHRAVGWFAGCSPWLASFLPSPSSQASVSSVWGSQSPHQPLFSQMRDGFQPEAKQAVEVRPPPQSHKREMLKILRQIQVKTHELMGNQLCLLALLASRTEITVL